MEVKSAYEKYGKSYYERNREKLLNQQREYYQKNAGEKRSQYRAKHRDLMLKRRCGISREAYEALSQAQGGVCAVCKAPPTTKALDVDHCHTTGAVRGLLCNNCNRGIGHLQDSPDLLQAAAAYLRCEISGKGGTCGS